MEGQQTFSGKFFDVTRSNPVYVIQKVTARRRGIPVLLGNELAATTIATSPWGERNLTRLRVKNDAGGVALGRVRLDNPFDVYGAIGGVGNAEETVRSINEKFSLKVRGLYKTRTDGEQIPDAIDLEGKLHDGTLILQRNRLCSVDSALAGAEADPHIYGRNFVDIKPLVLIPHSFQELVAEVRRKLSAQDFILVN
jgi:hypothetical protein